VPPKLLVIDDETDILEMMEGHFALRGFLVWTALDGAEGFEILEKERPEVVLLDLKMKNWDGDQFIKKVREKGIQTKILVITGYQDDTLRARVEALGVDAFLEKPVSIIELQKRIEELVGIAQ